MSMRKIAIAGGCGFVGSHLARALRKRGYELLLLDGFLSHVSPFQSEYQYFLKTRMGDLLHDPGVRVERCDLRIREQLQALLTAWKPEGVVHLAAIPGPREAALYPTEALQINVDGTHSLLESIKAAGSVKRLVFTSSSFVYGHFKVPVADETHTTEPIDIYGGSKLTGEILTRSYAKANGFEAVVVRPSAVYGFGDSNQRVSYALLESAMTGRPMQLHDGGAATIDFTYVDDIVDGFVRCLEVPEAAGETFNLTRGRARSIMEYAEVVKRHFPHARMESRATDHTRPARGTLSIEKARRILGYQPTIDIEEGIARYIAALRAQGPQQTRAEATR